MGQEEGNSMKKADLQAMTKGELEDLARDNEVEGRSGMSKDELVEALSKVRGVKSSKGETIMTTPREDQNASLGHQTRGPDASLTYEQPPSSSGDLQPSVGGTGGTAIPVTDGGGPAV